LKKTVVQTLPFHMMDINMTVTVIFVLGFLKQSSILVSPFLGKFKDIEWVCTGVPPHLSHVCLVGPETAVLPSIPIHQLIS